MKKISAIILCFVMATTLFCGCGNKDEDGMMSDINSTVSKVESDVGSAIMPDSSESDSGVDKPGNATDSEISSSNHSSK